MENDYQYCYVLCFESDMIYCINLMNADRKPSDFIDDSELLEYWGFDSNQCQWMFSDAKLNIIEINKQLV